MSRMGRLTVAYMRSFAAENRWMLGQFRSEDGSRAQSDLLRGLWNKYVGDLLTLWWGVVCLFCFVLFFVWFGLVWFGSVWLGWVGLVGCLVVGVDVSLTQRKERPRKAFLLERDPTGNRNQLSGCLHCIWKQLTIFSLVFMPGPSKGWCLNPKGLLSGTLYHPFGTPWRVQVCVYCAWSRQTLQMTPGQQGMNQEFFHPRNEGSVSGSCGEIWLNSLAIFVNLYPYISKWLLWMHLGYNLGAKVSS